MLLQVLLAEPGGVLGTWLLPCANSSPPPLLGWSSPVSSVTWLLLWKREGKLVCFRLHSYLFNFLSLPPPLVSRFS